MFTFFQVLALALIVVAVLVAAASYWFFKVWMHAPMGYALACAGAVALVPALAALGSLRVAGRVGRPPPR